MKTPKEILRECFPSLTDLAFLLPLIMLFTRLEGTRFLLGDADTGWHIRTGDWIRAHGRIPYQDIFSFTKPGQPWYAWEWLWDLVFSWIHSYGGLAAVVCASLLAICCTYAMLHRLIRRQCPNPLIAFAVFFCAVVVSSIHWLARPHLTTLLFVALFVTLLERSRRGGLWLLWLLPPLTVLWTNLHGGFLLAFVLTMVYAGGELAAWVAESDPDLRRAALRRGKPYLLCAAGCALATLVNPYFYHLHVHIARYLTDPFQFETVDEMRALSFLHPAARYLEVLLFLGVVAVFWHLRKKRFTEAFLVAVWIHPGLTTARNIPIFALLAAPGIAGMLHEWVMIAAQSDGGRWWKRAARSFVNLGQETAAMEAFGRIPAASVAAMAALIGAMLYLPGRPDVLRPDFDPKKFPTRALEVVRGGDLAEGIFSDDQWGDYLIYRLYPATKVFIDGRSDFYGPQFDRKYLDVLQGKYDWRKTLDRYGVNAALLRVDASLAGVLKESEDWRTVYDDGVAIVFLRRDSKAARAGRPGAPRSSAITDGGDSVIARSPTIPITIPVTERSRSFARR